MEYKEFLELKEQALRIHRRAIDADELEQRLKQIKAAADQLGEKPTLTGFREFLKVVLPLLNFREV